MKRFEVHPRGRNRIGETTMSESIARQQEAEFVIDRGVRYGQPGKNCDPQEQSRNAANQHAHSAIASHLCQSALGAGKPCCPKLWAKQRQQQSQRNQQCLRSYVCEHESALNNLPAISSRGIGFGLRVSENGTHTLLKPCSGRSQRISKRDRIPLVMLFPY